MVRYPAGSIHQKMMHCDHKHDQWSLIDDQLVLRDPKCARKYPTIITPPADDTRLVTPNISTLKQKLRLIRPGNVLPIFYCPVLLSRLNYSLSFCSHLTGVSPVCCWSSSASRFGVSCVQRCSSASRFGVLCVQRCSSASRFGVSCVQR